MSEYYGGLPENDYRDYLEHGKLWDWANHKYLYIDKNGNYVYARDVARSAKKKANQIATTARNKANEVGYNAYAKTAGIRTSLAKNSKKNKERQTYRDTGLTKKERDRLSTLESVRSDMRKNYYNEIGPTSGSNYKRTLGDRARAFGAHIGNSKLGKAAKKAKARVGYESYKVTQNARVKGGKLKKRAMSALMNTKLGKRYQAHKNTKLTGGGAR